MLLCILAIQHAAQSHTLNAKSKIKLIQPSNEEQLSEVPCIPDHFKIFLLLLCNVNIRLKKTQN